MQQVCSHNQGMPLQMEAYTCYLGGAALLKGGFACVQKAYIGNIAFYTRRNALRVAEISHPMASMDKGERDH
ncbi:unnamed protein product [Boreogadus saida]